MRTIVIGDIHGCSVEFYRMLDVCKFETGKDRLVLLGDLIDRGPESLHCVKLAKTTGAVMVRSNHEDKILRYHNHVKKAEADPKYKNPMQLKGEKIEVYEGLKKEGLLDWLSEAMTNSMLRYGNWTILHGGLVPGIPLDKQRTETLIRTSYVKLKPRPEGDPREGEPYFEMAALGKGLKPPEGSTFWTRVYTGPVNVIHGHSVRDRDNVLIEQHCPVPNVVPSYLTVSLDTGCVYGGHLSALIFHDDSFQTFSIKQVKAEKTYAKQHGEED